MKIDCEHSFLRKSSIYNWTRGLRLRAVEASAWDVLLSLLVIVSVDMPPTVRDFLVYNDTPKAGLEPSLKT